MFRVGIPLKLKSTVFCSEEMFEKMEIVNIKKPYLTLNTEITIFKTLRSSKTSICQLRPTYITNIARSRLKRRFNSSLILLSHR